MGNGMDMDLAGPRAGRPGHSRLRRDAVGAGRPVSAPREFFDSAANSRRALRAWGDRRGGVPTPTLRVAVTGAPISRRRALALITLGGASLAAGAAGWVAGLGAPGARGRLRPGPAGQLLTQPTVLASRNGVLRVRLTAAADVWLAGRHTTALGFNGTSSGPTLRVRPGDLLQVRLVNHFDQSTNLHTHGLHVSPEDHGDNLFVTIDPGATFDYTYRIPASYPAGTFWYHSHHYGHVADQIFGGLAGALLVDPGLDLPVTRDRVLLITDTTLDAAGRVAAVSAMDRMMGREGELVLVNGQHQPRIATTPGAADRWRIINGCTSRVLALRLDGHRLTQVALDGNFLPTPADRNLVVLAPGNRTDLIIRPTSSGQFALVTDPYNRGSTGMMGGMGMGGGSTSNRPITLATLAVTGPAAPPPSLPASLPAPQTGRSPTPAPWITPFTCTCGPSTCWPTAPKQHRPPSCRTSCSSQPAAGCACASPSPTTPAAASTTATSSTTKKRRSNRY